MSRKCPSCKKWLASGQFLCKCGAGETRELLSETVLSACEALIEKIGDTNLNPRWDRTDDDTAEPRRLECLAKAAELCKDEKVARHLASKGDFVVGLVQANAPELLQKVLPFVTRKLHEVRHHNISVINVAVICGRLRCLQLLLEDKTRYDATVADSTGMGPFELCAMMDEDASVVWGKGGFFARVLFGNEQLQRSDAGYAYLRYQNGYADDGSRPDDRRGLIAAMLSLLASATGRGNVLKGVDGMALRAQQAAVTGEVQTPPPFARVIWVLIVDKCALRERVVVLPLVCRFFRNLALPRDRCMELLKHFDLKTQDVGNNLENPAFLESLCRSFGTERVKLEHANPVHFWGAGGGSWGGSQNATQRLCLVLKDEKFVTGAAAAMPVLREFLLAPLAERWQEDIAGAPVEARKKVGRPPAQRHVHDGQPEGARPAEPGKEIFRIHRETQSGHFVTCTWESVTQRGVWNCRVRVGRTGKGAVTFAYKGGADRFGQVTPSFECHMRMKEGFDEVREIWNQTAPLDGKVFSKVLALIVSGLLTEEQFLKLFEASGEGFRVKYHADELEQSQDLSADDFSGISMIKALMWTPAQLAEFFEKNGISGATVLKKKLGGRVLVEAKNIRVFHEDSLKPKEARQVQDAIAALKARHFVN
jgi:hypothetical protein